MPTIIWILFILLLEIGGVMLLARIRGWRRKRVRCLDQVHTMQPSITHKFPYHILWGTKRNVMIHIGMYSNPKLENRTWSVSAVNQTCYQKDKNSYIGASGAIQANSDRWPWSRIMYLDNLWQIMWIEEPMSQNSKTLIYTVSERIADRWI